MKNTAELLGQCQKWYVQDEHQKIIDALEKIPEEKRTSETVMELARAYINQAVSDLRSTFTAKSPNWSSFRRETG